jgi:putative sigma-54 modulation protein
MRVIIQTPGVSAREPLLDFVKQKVGKLSDVSELLPEARVLLKTNKSDTRENKICEIRGFIYGSDVFSEKQAASFEEAVLKAVDAIKRQITDLKEKQIARPGLK